MFILVILFILSGFTAMQDDLTVEAKRLADAVADRYRIEQPLNGGGHQG